MSGNGPLVAVITEALAQDNYKRCYEKKEKKLSDSRREVRKTIQMMKHYNNTRLIDFLARGNILPRYGFPVDTVELEQNATATNIRKLRLSRDLSIAIAEYAPSSEVIADGKLYTNRYIKKSNIEGNKREWKTAYLARCKNEECQVTNYSIAPITKEGVKCTHCGNRLTTMDFSVSIEPVCGYITEREAKEAPLARQEKKLQV